MFIAYEVSHNTYYTYSNIVSGLLTSWSTNFATSFHFHLVHAKVTVFVTY